MSSAQHANAATARRTHSPLLTAAVLLVYASLLALVIPRHEPFGDEQTAWQLAQHSSFTQLFTTVLRHEGTPGLWHMMLWVLTRLHLSFLDARCLAAVVPVAGVWVWMRFSPFPLWLRAVTPFTFFLVYQYAIVARQYVFFPMLVFALAALSCSTRWRPWLFAVCAGLLANVSFHGFLYTLAFSGAVCALRKRLPFSLQTDEAGFYKQNARPLALLCVCILIAAASAVPLPHHGPAAAAVAAPQPALPAAYAVIPLEEPLDTPWLHVPPAGMNGIEDSIWRATMLRAGTTPSSTLKARALHAAVIGLSLLGFPIAKSNLLAWLLLALLGWRLHRQRTRVLLAPYGLIWLAILFLHGYEHHTGMLFVCVLTALWVSFALDPLPPESAAPWLLIAALARRSSRQRLADGLLAVLAIVLFLQLGWSTHALVADAHHLYTGDEQAALFLEQVARHHTIARGEIGLITNPPFYTHGFETPAITAATPPYSPDEHASEQALLARLALHPDYVVEGSEMVGPDNVKNQVTPMVSVGGAEYVLGTQRLLRAAGYRETHRFCGDNFMRDGYSRQLCQIVFEPVAP